MIYFYVGIPIPIIPKCVRARRIHNENRTIIDDVLYNNFFFPPDGHFSTKISGRTGCQRKSLGPCPRDRSRCESIFHGAAKI